ncbi:TonB-linked outer membrane protein, SusC/RagA family [Sphingobacterium wenxiniae]|uniref:TonB-linked outer membrane protein, SusC/RagA family n=1 Tax=Sphingobacterium wenxiniae TaxID=683125 RepID=A0A1I6PG63_9SPHI|nr:TonB-linked outer membrane protein, SusC/RagA family [Sphingobacterium wenxiniae]
MNLKKVMRLSTIVFCIVSTVSGTLYAKSSFAQLLATKVEIAKEVRNASEIIKDLEHQKIRLIYDRETLNLTGIPSNLVQKGTTGTVEQILKDAFRGTEIVFEEKASFIVLKKRQQPGRIVGQVRDSNGEVLAGATVKVIETGRNVGTDTEGRFSMSLQPGSYTAEISYISFGTQRKNIVIEEGKTLTMNIALSLEGSELDQVVVVGYGTQQRSLVTGSVSTLESQKLVAAPAINPSDAIAGRVPGLVALTPSGEPGSSSGISIRGSNTLGNNSPLIVVDGVPNREWERLNPQDIESITVLKDASAAIYGARAANGVILVTTKKGNSGKPMVQFNYNEGIAAPTVVPEAADAATYAQLLNEVLIYEGASPMYSDEDIKKYKDGSDPLNFPNTDWYKSALKKWSTQRTADVNISGGQESLRYYLSAGTRYQDAIYKNSATSYKQHNLRLNLDGNISPYISYGVNAAIREVHRNYPTESASSIWNRLRSSKPNMPDFWPTGEPADNGDSGNPVVITTNQTGYDRNKSTVIETRGFLDLRAPWVDGLSVSLSAAMDNTIQNDKLWKTPWYLYAWDRNSMDAQGFPELNRVQRGYSNAELRQDMSDTRLVTLNALGKYKFQFDRHKFDVMAGVERIEGDKMNFFAFRKHYVSTAIDQLFAGGDLEKDNGGVASEEARLNYFGRVNYNGKDRYLIDFVWRYDGSYIFPQDGRFGFFPGISGGWRVSEEAFWQPIKPWVNEFKFRASWGKTGNDRIDPYQFLPSYAYGTGVSNIYIFNETELAKILAESSIANPAVTWEVAKQTNVGVDMQFLNNKISLSAEYFYNHRTDILWRRNASIPGSTGMILPDENIGEVINRGAEFQLAYNGSNGDLSYTLSANVSLNRNKIQFWDETPGAPEYQQSTGRPMNTGLYYKAIGIFRDEAAVEAYPHWTGARPGDVIFEDVNGDGKIDGLDRVRMDKTSLPTHIGGFNTDLAYKEFSASIFFQWALGAVRNDYFEMQGQIGNYLTRDAEGRWTPENPDADQPRIWNRYNEYWRSNQNTYWLQNTDYLRLKSVRLGYKLPKSLSAKLYTSDVQLYVSGLNLLTFSGIKDVDPESTSNTAYPANKVYNMGLSISF